jgi:hypothetical protein
MGTTLGAIDIIFIFIILSFILYFINLKITIKVLKKEIFRYKKIIVNYQIKEKNFINNTTGNEKYNSLRKNINDLKLDLVETDFSDFDNVKNDLLLALENIDIYDEL